VTIDARDRIRAHRFRVIEVKQHGRMAFDRGQHVDEAAKDVRAYRLALIGTGHRNDLVGRNTEMIRPKPNKALDEADVRGDGGFDADFGLVLNELSGQWRRLLALLDLSRFRLGSLRIPVWFHRSVVGRADNHALRLRLLLRTLRQLFLRLPFSAELEEGPPPARCWAGSPPRRDRRPAVRGRPAMRRTDRPRSRRSNRRPARNRTGAMPVLLQVSGWSSCCRLGPAHRSCGAHRRSISFERRAAFEFHQRWHS